DHVYDSAPWAHLYGTTNNAIKDQAQQQRFTNIPAMIVAAAKQFGTHTAFTTCMPNGMNGTLTYRQADELSDAFAVYLRETLGLAKG
ncbi:hypothetical protein, partial [Bacillus cereus group sp. Bce002]|uniref:hypothetical protein n=1 Tax=Bacillus cereus group sp. Bce002 TaxID=3445259 RepID=UPI003F1E7D55